MPKTPPSGAAQPDIAAASRHEPAPTGAGDSHEEGLRPPHGQRPGGFSGQHPHLFHLANASPDVFEGGTLQGATQDDWKILEGQQGSVYLARLKPGGIREPHWHPSAWELNFIVSGKARWSFVGPEATHDAFIAESGDLVFAPQGHLHYFENASETEDLVALLVFNTSASEPQDDVGLVASLSAIPAEVLAAIFKTSPEAFENLPRKIERVTIARREQKPGGVLGAIKSVVGKS